MNWTQAQAEAYLAKRNKDKLVVGLSYAYAHPICDRYRNKWERNYAQYLDLRKYIKEIACYRYEGLAFRLATNTYLHPDFLVVMPDGRMEIHEVKGHKREKWWARFKIAREMFPWFTWRVVKIEKGQWVEVP
jgi:hypothetical protein